MYKFSKYKEQYKLNLQLAIPVVMSQLGNIVVQIVDNAMVGQYGGDDPLPLAATAFGSSIFMVLFVTAMGLSLGLTPLVGELYAQGRHGRAAEYLQNGIVLYSLVGLLIMGVQLATIPLFQYMGQPAEVIEAATPYYMTLTLGMLPLMIFFTFKQFLEGLGNTKVAMYCVIISNVVNVFFNWVFISGNLGAPELGATGAGIATLISRVLMAVMLVLYFFKSGEFGDYIIRFARVNIKRASQLKLVMMGIPISSQIFLEVTAFVITGVMCGWLGTTAITANQIGMTLGHSAFAIVMSIGVATTIRISHCFGRRSIREMRLASKAAWHLGLAWNVAIAIFFITLSGVLPKLFSTNAEVIDLASTIIIFIVMYQIPDGVQSISVGILRGMQDVRVIIPIAFISYWVVAIPVGYLFAFPVDWGPKGLYVGHIFGLSTASILMIWRIKWGQNRLLRGAK